MKRYWEGKGRWVCEIKGTALVFWLMGSYGSWFVLWERERERDYMKCVWVIE